MFHQRLLGIVALVALLGAVACGDDSARHPTGDANNNDNNWNSGHSTDPNDPNYYSTDPNDPNNPNYNNNNPNNPIDTNNPNNPNNPIDTNNPNIPIDTNNPNIPIDTNNPNTPELPPIPDDWTYIPDNYTPNYPGADNYDSIPETALTCDSKTDAGGLSVEGMAVWRDDAEAAYSMIFDDMCGYAVRQLPIVGRGELNRHNIMGSPGIIVSECIKGEGGSTWNDVLSMIHDGHEMSNHSMNHEKVEGAAIEVEAVQSKQYTDQIFAMADEWQKELFFFVYPYDYFPADGIAGVQRAGHIGSRAGNRDPFNGSDNPPINGNEATGDMTITFDVWPRTYSKYARYYEEDVLWNHVYNAIDLKGWAVREFHSVVNDNDYNDKNQFHGFGPIKASDFNTHLNELVDAWKKNKVWTSTPGRILKYRQSRTKCTASASGNTLTYNCSGLDNKLAGEASIIVKTGSDVPGLEAMQQGAPVSVRKLGASRFAVTGHVLNGPIEISGCNTASVGVDAGAVRVKPTPAASVCDIQTVVGTGSDGQMDDLERDPEVEFQSLPNPQQRDGRDGSWSSYPGSATLEHIQDGSNGGVVHFKHDTSAQVYGGVSLAFLGGNGAGSCYDASAYQGIQFDIKGTVVDNTSWLATKNVYFLSLVSAKTQTSSYGGDVDCAVGHYSFELTIPSSTSYTTVKVPWSSFVASSYVDENCSIPGFTHPSPSLDTVKKTLQAIDWGCTNEASTCDIYLDNIRLY
ncbi:MAG: hypothetical protein M0R76_13710 [Proteobacteria bacterium]|nr:hypothetical protein [Pseudomonadota bacterium]